MDLSDKVVIITGAASGIGAEILRLFLEANARLVAVDVDPHQPSVMVRDKGGALEYAD